MEKVRLRYWCPVHDDAANVGCRRESMLALGSKFLKFIMEPSGLFLIGSQLIMEPSGLFLEPLNDLPNAYNQPPRMKRREM